MKPSITIEQFIQMHGDKDGIQWNFNHIGRYANKKAALQFYTARANASHCSFMAIEELNKFEDSNYTDEAAKIASDEWFRMSKEWHKVADSFREAMHIPDEDLGTRVIVSGGEVLEISNVTNPDDEIPF